MSYDDVDFDEKHLTNVFMAIEHGWRWTGTPDEDYWTEVAKKLYEIDPDVQDRCWRGTGVPSVGHLDCPMVLLGADSVSWAFAWDTTPDGHDYWMEVQKRLFAVVGQATSSASQPSHVDDYDRAMRGI